MTESPWPRHEILTTPQLEMHLQETGFCQRRRKFQPGAWLYPSPTLQPGKKLPPETTLCDSPPALSLGTHLHPRWRWVSPNHHGELLSVGEQRVHCFLVGGMAQVNAVHLQNPVPNAEPAARRQPPGNDLQRTINTAREGKPISPWRCDCVPRHPPTPCRPALTPFSAKFPKR